MNQSLAESLRNLRSNQILQHLLECVGFNDLISRLKWSERPFEGSFRPGEADVHIHYVRVMVAETAFESVALGYEPNKLPHTLLC